MTTPTLFKKTSASIAELETGLFEKFKAHRVRKIRNSRKTLSGHYLRSEQGGLPRVSQLMTSALQLEEAYYSRFVILVKSLRSLKVSIDEKNLIQCCLLLRTILERIAFIEFFRKSLLENTPEPERKDLHKFTGQLDEYLGKFATMNFGMGKNVIHWVKEGLTSERAPNINPDEFYYTGGLLGLQVDDLAQKKPQNLKATNVMTRIEGVDRKIPGFLNCYDFLCEFIHPNFGDVYSATEKMKAYETPRNKLKVLERHYGINSSWSMPDDILGLFVQADDILSEAITFSFSSHAEIKQRINDWVECSRNNIHFIVNRARDVRKGDECPCLSGLRVKDCAIVIGKPHFKADED